jgi:lipid-binding SYLF domain-containing protein
MRDRILRRWIAVVAALTFAVPLAADTKQQRRVESARWVYESVFNFPGRTLPRSLFQETRCLAIFPGVKEAALVIGGSHGTGVVSCRNREGRWSPPSFVKLTEGSIGLQVGYQSVDVILFFVTDRAADSLLKSKFSLGGDVSIKAGSLEDRAGMTTSTILRADVYIFAQSKGLFVSAAFDGTRLGVSDKANRSYYGHHVWPKSILFDHEVPTEPAQMREFVDGIEALDWEPIDAEQPADTDTEEEIPTVDVDGSPRR